MRKIIYLVFLIFYGCVSGVDQDVRNADIFKEAKLLSYQLYQEGNYDFNGKIQDLINFISSQLSTTELDPVPNPFEIEGIVSLPSNFGFALSTSTNPCNAYSVYARSFILQDQNAGILVAYGLEPPDTNAANANSMKYILNARNPNRAVFGERIKMKVKKVQKYGTPTNFVPIITDFETPEVISQRNPVRYSISNSPFSKSNDLYRVREITGFVKKSPEYVECASGTQREFQIEYQTSYNGELCVGATSASDAQNCTGSKILYKFKLSVNLGAGTLSGFDVGEMFSYNLAQGAYVRMRGPVIIPNYAGTDADLTLLIDQKHQVETLKPP